MRLSKFAYALFVALLVGGLGASCPDKQEQPQSAMLPPTAAPQPVVMTLKAAVDQDVFKKSVDEFVDADSIHTLNVDGPLSDDELKALSSGIERHAIDLRELSVDLSAASSESVKSFFNAVIANGFVGQLKITNQLKQNQLNSYTADLLAALESFTDNAAYNHKDLSVLINNTSPDTLPGHSFISYFAKHVKNKLNSHEFLTPSDSKNIVVNLKATVAAPEEKSEPGVLVIPTDARFARGLNLLKRNNDAIKTVVVKGEISGKQGTELVETFKLHLGSPLVLNVKSIESDLDLDKIVNGLAFAKLSKLVIRSWKSNYGIYKSHLHDLLYALSEKHPGEKFVMEFLEPKLIAEIQDFWRGHGGELKPQLFAVSGSGSDAPFVIGVSYNPIVKYSTEDQITLHTGVHFSAELEHLKDKQHLKALTIEGLLDWSNAEKLINALHSRPGDEWLDLLTVSTDGHGYRGLLKALTRMRVGHLVAGKVSAGEPAHLDGQGKLYIANAKQFEDGMNLLGNEASVKEVKIENALTAEQHEELKMALGKRHQRDPSPINLDIDASLLDEEGTVFHSYLYYFVTDLPKLGIERLVVRGATDKQALNSKCEFKNNVLSCPVK